MSVTRGLHRPDRREPGLGRHREHADQHQPARSEVPEPLGGDTTSDGRRTRSSASPRRGQFASRATIELGQLLRPYPQFGNVYMQQSTGAHSQYHAGIVQVRKRTTGLWGGNFSYTYSRLNDNQFGAGQLLLSAPGLQNNYTVDSGLAVLQPGSGVRPQPARLAAQGRASRRRSSCRSARDERFLSNSRHRQCAARRLVDHAGDDVPERIPDRRQPERAPGTTFLFGGTLRPNIVAGAGHPRPRRHHRAHHAANTTDNLYLNQAAFSTSPAQPVRQRAAHPAGRLFALAQQRRSVGRQERPDRRRGPRRRCASKCSTCSTWCSGPRRRARAFGNSSFGQITNQANNMRMMQFTLRFQF